jgi:general secretion pathway protein A
MYTRFFGLTEKPFAITPDPRYVFLSERHAEALAHLLYGINDAGGFVQLTGEVGTGKTTMIRSLLGQLPPHVDVALILNPRVTPEEFLLAILDELHLARPPERAHSIKSIVDALNARLLAAHAEGRKIVVLVDEAQQLSVDVLEQVRLLTNLETATEKLLQIILVGQPELRELLARNDLRQLAQRITGRYHLAPLSAEESARYIRHRLRVAGATTEIFTDRALAVLAKRGHGVPRLLNVIADRALLGAYTAESHRVTPALVRRAAAEVRGQSSPRIARRVAGITPVVIALSVIAIGGYLAATRLFPPSPRLAATPAPIAPQTAPAPAPPPPPSVLEFLTAHATETGTDTAFARLFGVWGLSPDPADEKPCARAAREGFACVSAKGSFAEVARFNRPAILSLATPDGAEHQVVLLELDEKRARIAAGDAVLDADLLDLGHHWLGEFLVLWHPPVANARLIRPGLRGPEVPWLRTAIAAVMNTPTSVKSDLYDAALRSAVEAFQRDHHLTVDGIVGQETLLLLDGLAPKAHTPTLGNGER